MKTHNGAPVRVESDSMGKIEVPADKYYGAQSARSLVHFDIGDGAWPRDVMPKQVIRAMALLKKKMEHVNATEAGVIAASNPGCMLQLRAGVRKFGQGQRVAHVVEILDEAYGSGEES